MATLTSAGAARDSLVHITENWLGGVARRTGCPGRGGEPPDTLSGLNRRGSVLGYCVTAVPGHPIRRLRGSLLTGCRLAGRWPAPSGNILPHHHKINELDITLDLYAVGDRLGVVEAGLGTVGLATCADNFGSSLASPGLSPGLSLLTRASLEGTHPIQWSSLPPEFFFESSMSFALFPAQDR